jgi:hypothetical protein
MKTINVSSQDLIEAKEQELTAKIAAYQAAQAHQLEHGGPGPVSDYEVMSIVNEHNGEFEVVAPEPEEILEEPVE